MPQQPFGFNLQGGIEGFWDDMRFPATRVRRGVNEKPDFDYTNLGLLFPQNNTTEKINITDQMPHAWKSGSTIYPHVHFIQAAAALPTWKLNYRFYNNGAAVPDYTTIETGATGVFTYPGSAILQIVEFPALVLPALGLSAWFDFVFYRDDNAVAGDVLFKGFDFHLLSDSWGSVEPHSKY